MSAQDREELGTVVLRAEGPRRMRPLLLCAALLLLTEAALRLTLPPDGRVLLDPLHPYGCFREAELARLRAARRADPPEGPLDVVLLGDSVLSSVNNPPGERLEDLLAPRLVAGLGAKVRVWNLGQGGARAGDQLAAFAQLLAALGPRPRRLLVVLSSNVIFFSRRHAQPPLLYGCLGPALAADAEALALLRPPPPPTALERRLVEVLTRNVYLLQQRRRIGEALFGGPPREAIREKLLTALGRLGLRPGGAEVNDPNLPWTARGLLAAAFAPSYDFLPPGSPEAVNERASRLLGRRVAASGLPALAVLVPQNHALLGPLAAGPAYDAVCAAAAAAFSQAGVPFRSYDGLVDGGLFTDLDHLTAAGNARLAELLAADLLPLLRGLLDDQGRAGPPP